ncbi:HlyD family efflux transporter periplasmic adaptor subunit [Bowmanella denitrificans]|uniref:HlyD family efflux transporter periplasmic adaptor subunit n=1 Tax=Bowmanella denitrificans TaxID=366582 RepID=A0ABN0X1F4_9ALTE
MKKQLFREQVLDAKKTSMFGRVVLTQPLSVSVGLALTLGTLVAVLAFLWLFQYQHKMQVITKIEPQNLVNIPYQGPPVILKQHLVAPGSRIEAGKAVAKITTDSPDTVESGQAITDRLAYLQRTLVSTQQRQQLLAQYLAEHQGKLGADQLLQQQLQLIEAQDQTNRLNYDIAQLQAVLDKQQGWQTDGDMLKAQHSGVLQQWYVKEGQNLRMGELLYRLGDADGKLQAWFLLPASWYGDIEPGQSVQVRFDDYPYQKFGVLDATVQQVGNRQESGGYAAMVMLPRHWADKTGQQQPLFEGMQVTAVLQGPSQSLFSWLFRI